MERVFAGTDKIIIDSGTARSGAQDGVVPYLPLKELTREPSAQPQIPAPSAPPNAPPAGGIR
jgi:hypothetical protein